MDHFDGIPLSTEMSVFEQNATWSSTNSVLSVMTVEALQAMVMYTFNVSVANPPAGQHSPVVKIEIVGQIAVSTTPMSKGAGLQAPLAVLSLFPIAQVSQSTFDPGASNTLTISLRSRDALYAALGTKLTLSGLLGASNDGVQGPCGSSTLFLSNTSANGGDCNLKSCVSWTKATGTVIFSVAGDIPGNITCVVALDVVNSLEPQFSPEIMLSSDELHLLDRVIDRGMKNSAPLLIAGFLSASMNQSNPFMGNQNRLFFSFTTTVSLMVADNFVHCANENTLCTCVGLVRLGESSTGTWSEPRDVTAGIMCDSSHFSDPMPGAIKTCQCKSFPKVRLSGLTGSVTSSSHALAICDGQCVASDDLESVEECCSRQSANSTASDDSSNLTISRRHVNTTGVWNRGNGTLVVTFLRSTSPATRYAFSFLLENPTLPRDGVPVVSVQGLGTAIPSFDASLGTGNQAPMLVAGWSVKSIGQRFPASNALNTISVTIASEAQLEKEMVGGLVVRGLEGTSTPAGQVSVDTSGPFSSTAAWEPSNGTLAFKLTGTMFPNVPYVLSVVLQNQVLGRNASTGITIEAIDPGGLLLFPPIPMDEAGGNNAPFLVADFLHKSISQSTMAALANNTITITISTRTELEGLFKTSIHLTGLTGSGTRGSNVKIMLSPADTPFGPYGRWYHSIGMLKLKVINNEGTVARKPYVLSFVLNNGPDMQVGRNVTVSASYQYYQSREFSYSGPWTAAARMINGEKLFAPLLIVGFDVVAMAQSSATFDSLNELSLNLSTNVDVFSDDFPSLRFIIEGLHGIRNPSGIIKVCIAPRAISNMTNCSTELEGVWDRGQASLNVPLPSGFDLLESVVYNLKFVVQNSEFSQESQNVSIRATGIGFDIATRSVQRAVGDAAPLKIVGWVTKMIAQSTASIGEINTISVTISTSGAMRPGTEIRINGLTGATTSSGDIAILCPQHPSTFRNTGSWNVTTGTLVIRVDFLTAPYTQYAISFDITNPLTGQMSPDIAIAGYYNGVACLRQVMMEKANDNGAPMLVASFWSKKIGQSSVSASSLNTITVTMSMYSALQADQSARISISGLLGSDTPSGTLQLNSDNGTRFYSRFGTEADWHQSNGTLVLTVVADSEMTVNYLFSFELMNPADGHNSTTINIVSTGTSSNVHRMVNGEGNNAPMLVADFLVAKLGQSDASQGAINTLTITLQTRASLAPGTVITISGLTGSIVSDSQSIPVQCPGACASFRNEGSWAKLDGIFKLVVDSYTEAGKNYLLAFVLRNPHVPQVTPAPACQQAGLC